MTDFIRLVNQQLAYAEFHLNALNTADAFGKRCHQRAACLQLSLGLNAYAAELCERAGVKVDLADGLLNAKPIGFPYSFAHQAMFLNVQTQLLGLGKTASEVDELALLSDQTSWLGQLLQALMLEVTQDASSRSNPMLSPMLSHTTLTAETENMGLIATNRAANGRLDVDFPAAVTLLKALIQRQRDNKAEY